MNTEIRGTRDAGYNAMLNEIPAGEQFLRAILFEGDRRWCCDEVVVVIYEDRVIAAATIAPKGEEHSGTPTMVGIYVLPEFRRNGIGTILLVAALSRCSERGFSKVRVDLITVAAKALFEKFIASMPLEITNLLEVHDSGFLF